MDEPQAGRTLVLGLGNPLMGDDGVGLAALRELTRRYELPEGVDLLEGGTAGLTLLAHLEGYTRILIADCAALGRTPGQAVRIDRSQLGAAFSQCLSPHELGLNDLLGALELLGERPEQVTVIGMEPGSLEMNLELSDPVSKGLPAMVAVIAKELADWGIPLRRHIAH